MSPGGPDPGGPRTTRNLASSRPPSACAWQGRMRCTARGRARAHCTARSTLFAASSGMKVDAPALRLARSPAPVRGLQTAVRPCAPSECPHHRRLEVPGAPPQCARAPLSATLVSASLGSISPSVVQHGRARSQSGRNRWAHQPLWGRHARDSTGANSTLSSPTRPENKPTSIGPDPGPTQPDFVDPPKTWSTRLKVAERSKFWSTPPQFWPSGSRLVEPRPTS